MDRDNLNCLVGISCGCWATRCVEWLV